MCISLKFCLNFCALLFLQSVFSCFNYNNYNKKKIFESTETEPHVAVLILARGGSKGIELKNIQKVKGVTLLGRSLTEILKISDFSSVWVSTDHNLIAKEAQKYKGVNVHWRNAQTATDDASSFSAIQEFLKIHYFVDQIVLVQCTSPFLRKEYLIKAKTQLRSKECVFSVSRFSKLLWHRDRNGKVKPRNFDLKNRPRRQDLFNAEFVENGMFYLFRRELINKGKLQSKNCDIIEIPQYHDMEIDNPVDLYLANMLQDYFLQQESK